MASAVNERTVSPPAHSADVGTLSPELVLVAPPAEAERARRALPDRPWEMFLPEPPPVRLDLIRRAGSGVEAPEDRGEVEPPCPVCASRETALRLAIDPPVDPGRPAEIVSASVVGPSPPAQAPTPPPRASSSGVRWWSGAQRTVVVVTLCAVALLWAADRTPIPGLVGDAAPPIPPAPTTSVSPKAPAGSKAPAQPVRPSSSRRLEIPSPAGYIFSFGVLEMKTPKRGVIRFTNGCGSGGETPPFTVTGRRLAFNGSLRGANVDAALNGRFRRADLVSLRIKLTGRNCKSGAIDLLARLS